MARFDRMTVLNTLLADGVMPIFYQPDLSIAKQIIASLVKGGIRLLEFTNRGDFAIEVYSELLKEARTSLPDAIIGAGTIEDAPTAALYIAHGANFIVAPNFNPEVARLCNRRKIAYIPGCATVSEISTAEEYGSEVVKLFPGETVGGPEFVKAMLGPRPWSRLLATGGVTPDPDSLKAWFEAGISCVGMGSKLIRADWMKAQNYDAITDLAHKTLGWIKDARG
jgi:2-dehydro-3-deoxyphosphogluconate aldolase / (4S)-4-hydroxy-2-oxoglutarate aldolase